MAKPFDCLLRLRFICTPTLVALCWVFFSCENQQPQTAQLVILGGEYYTADSAVTDPQSIAVIDGKIALVGTRDEAQSWIGPNTKVLDGDGLFIMPGLIEGHGHFFGLGQSLHNLNFLKSTSWDSIAAMLVQKVDQTPENHWIIGRGWHQEKISIPADQSVQGYPTHQYLTEAAPNNPVMLTHASGHALIANLKAMQLAGVSKESADPAGGHILRDANGNPTGVFEERAMEMIKSAFNESQTTLSKSDKDKQRELWLKLAQSECLKKGITTFHDAGTSIEDLIWLRQYTDSVDIDIRLWLMIREKLEDLQGQLSQFPWIGLADDHLTVRALKSEIDGALGSYGAWLLKPYNDKPSFDGQNTTPLTNLKGIAELAKSHKLQLCVHAIGDRGNRIVLDLFEEMFKAQELPNTWRWRVEHAQHLHPDDIPRFAELGAIAAMQAVHCTSDAPFVVERLGVDRAYQGAYAWRSLLETGAWVSNGTDAPVEDVDPLPSLYASFTRKRPGDTEAFMPHQTITRQEALFSYTMANAYAGFEEHLKGSLTVGKLGDITIFNKNLFNCPEDEFLDAKVEYTIIGGRIVYQRQGH
jgi:predicted amidohydrolase YtcJ